jgi:hypothetical protein
MSRQAGDFQTYRIRSDINSSESGHVGTEIVYSQRLQWLYRMLCRHSWIYVKDVFMAADTKRKL